jgi:hypothetical protein
MRRHFLTTTNSLVLALFVVLCYSIRLNNIIPSTFAESPEYTAQRLYHGDEIKHRRLEDENGSGQGDDTPDAPDNNEEDKETEKDDENKETEKDEEQNDDDGPSDEVESRSVGEMGEDQSELIKAEVELQQIQSRDMSNLQNLTIAEDIIITRGPDLGHPNIAWLMSFPNRYVRLWVCNLCTFD